MKRFVVGFGALAVGVLLLTVIFDSEEPVVPPAQEFDAGTPSAREEAGGNLAVSEEDEKRVLRVPLSRVASSPSEGDDDDERPGILSGLNDSEGSITEDIRLVANLLDSYYSVFHQYPWGDNAEMVSAFAGGNQRGIVFFERDEAPLDKDGKLVDRWGTPFFFHRIAANVMEIRSGGADGKMWTEDDHSSLETDLSEAVRR